MEADVSDAPHGCCVRGGRTLNRIVQTQGRAPRRSPRPLGEREQARCKVEARPSSGGSDARGRVLVRTPEQDERRYHPTGLSMMALTSPATRSLRPPTTTLGWVRKLHNYITAAAREDERTPRMHKVADGSTKQYKGRRNFRFLAESVRKISLHRGAPFCDLSHFKGCHRWQSVVWRRTP